MKTKAGRLVALLATTTLLVEAFQLPYPTRRPHTLSPSCPTSSTGRITTHPPMPTRMYNAPPSNDGSSPAVALDEKDEEKEEEEPTTTNAALASVFSLWKRRLWTKADYLHSHAISGTAFMVLGALYVFYFLSDELFAHGALAQAEHGVVGWVPLAIMWTGVVNCISCLPMSKFRTGPSGGMYVFHPPTPLPIYSFIRPPTHPPLDRSIDPFIHFFTHPPTHLPFTKVTTPRARVSKAWALA